MKINVLLEKPLEGEFLTQDEGVHLFLHASTPDLMQAANKLRNAKRPSDEVTWIIDRNVNTTNVCIANCKFCNFYRIPGHKESYITTIEEYKEKIDETFRYGGDQLLLQGGHHPDLGLNFYANLFRVLDVVGRGISPTPDCNPVGQTPCCGQKRKTMNTFTAAKTA